MKYALRSCVLLLLVAACRQPVTGSPPPLQQTFTIGGVVSGRVSRAPMTKAWVCLGRLTKDDMGKDTEVILTEFSAITDDKGNFQLKGVPAGTYTVVYRPAPASGTATAPPKAGTKISVIKLAAGIRSFMPMLRGQEIGRQDSFAERPWAAGFTVLKGHTLYATSGEPLMIIWNASVRSGRQGPVLELRRNRIWSQDVVKNTQIKFEAWSF